VPHSAPVGTHDEEAGVLSLADVARVNAIHLPSGDQAIWKDNATRPISLRTRVPSARMTKIPRPRPLTFRTKASRLPSGDHVGLASSKR
jgi:hypothetical protein